MRVTYLVPRMGVGGAERHLISLASGLRNLGVEARIDCVFEEGALAEEIRAKGIPFECLRAQLGWGPKTLLRIFKSLRRNPADILHNYLFGFDFYGALPARLAKIPAVISTRREIAHWQKPRHLLLARLGNLFSDRIVCCSSAARAWAEKKEKVDGKKLLTIHNGVDLNRFSPTGQPKVRERVRRDLGIPAAAVLIGAVANFSPEKGHEYLLEAAGTVLKTNSRAWFLLVGGGPLMAEMKLRAQKMPGADRILFAGQRADIPELLEAMDLFVLASVIEGFPNVLLEAMAMSKPVVATETGGIPELIQSGTDGLLVTPKDSVQLAAGIQSLISDTSVAVRLGMKAREKIKKDFSIERMIHQYEKLYEGLLEAKGKS
jgi:glycosyltransferase involved in cell wall biosynthesis